MLRTLTKEEISERFESLPQNLKDAILSASVSSEVERIGQINHLSDDKIARLALVVGRVFMGFIDTDDSTKEIKDYVDVPVEIASSLARELNRKIFNYYEADIVKAYAPAEGVTVETKGPATPKPSELRPMEIRKEAEAMPIGKQIPAPAMPSPIARIPSPMPTPIPMQRPASEPALIPPMKFTEHTATAAPTAPAPQTPSAPPASTPFILHKEEKVKPISELKPIEISFTSPETKKPAEKPLVAAELELGKEEEKRKEPIIGKTPEQSQRVVHYSDFRTPINPFERRVEGTAPRVQNGLTPTPATPAFGEARPAERPQPTQPTPTPTPKTPPQTPVAPTQAEPAMKPAPVVKMEGNVLDLRQKP